MCVCMFVLACMCVFLTCVCDVAGWRVYVCGLGVCGMTRCVRMTCVAVCCSMLQYVAVCCSVSAPEGRSGGVVCVCVCV